jgi:hypothetical protein
MSIFGSILHKLGLGGASSDAAPVAAAATTDAPAAPDAPAAAPPAASASAAPQAAPAAPVDVAAVLGAMPGSSNLNWRTSIVDLMKLLGLDSSLTARKELADELGFTGDKNDSASMNIWLQKQVMTKLAENGGKVPNELKV